MRANSIDFQEVNQQAARQLSTLLHRFLPGGVVRGHEYIVRNPTRADRTPGSFKINLHTGRWSDFATNDSGGDVISLVAYVNRIGQLDAARLVIEAMGGNHA